MNTIPHPDSKPNPARAKAMWNTHKLLMKLGFRLHESIHEGTRKNPWYIMPDYPGPVLVVEEPLANVQEVITAVYAWGHAEGRKEKGEEVRAALGISMRT